MDKPVKLKARKKARTLALQSLYQWQMSGASLSDIEQQQFENVNINNVDVPYFQELFHQIPKRLTEIDELYESFLDRGLDELNPIERTVLRIGSYELLERKEIPYQIILKEAVSLARLFGATDGYKYVNGILDKVSIKLRQVERSNDS